MSFRNTRLARLHWLFAILLLVGQMGLVLHDAQHWQPKVDGDVCQLCVHHVSQHEIASGTVSFAIALVPESFLVFSSAVSASLAPRPLYQSRGPPAVSI